MFSGSYENETKEDSVFVENDSLAFWEGIKSFAAERMADKLIREKGIKNPPFTAQSFDVLDEYGVSILNHVSVENKAKGFEFIKQHE